MAVEEEPWVWFHLPMIFNVSGKAVPCLICSWESVISWCCLNLNINKAIPSQNEYMGNMKMEVE